MNLKAKSLLRLGTALMAVGLSGCLLAIAPRSGPHHFFPVEPARTFLTEALAVEKARECLAREGYDLEQWRMTTVDHSPSKAPDGTPDRYFYRFSFSPTAGRVHFSNGQRTRTVDVRLDGSRIVCSMFYGL